MRLLLLLLLCPFAAFGQAQVEMVNSYPELHVDGKPFFVHSAAFFYYRAPETRWEPFLRRYREMGINTIDVYVPWNWHEPVEGKLDLSSAARLLQLAGKLGLRVILRPGPVMLNEWRNGGYPDWLLQRPEFKMPLLDVLEGRYPPLAGLAPTNSEEASRGWLANPTHMRYARAYMQAVARELIVPNSRNILFVQLDDDQALNRPNYNGPVFWKYMHTLREWLAEGGNDRPVFINPTDMRVSAAGFDSAQPQPIFALGQWYQQAARPEDAARVEVGLPLRAADYAELEFFTDTLKTQPGFPAMIIEFQAGWYCPADDTAPRASHPANTLLASRYLWANGLRGINYFPLQDTVYPSGYEVPWANRHYNWVAALDVDGNEQPKAAAVRRNGRLIEGLGPQLAATHKWVDAGLIYPLGAYPQKELSTAQIDRISNAAIDWQQALRAKSISTDLVDPEYQTVEQLRRYPVLLLKRDPSLKMSERAESVIRESGVPVLEAFDHRTPPVVRAPAGVQVTAALSNSAPYYGFLFTANPDYQQNRTATLIVRDPRNAAKSLALPKFTLPAHESLTLPLRLPLCEACGDEVVWATAELHGFSKVGRAYAFDWYAPQPARALLIVDGRERFLDIPPSAPAPALNRLPPLPMTPEPTLDNGRLRIVVTPDAGGRAFTLARNGVNATTTVGFFRDRFTKYDGAGRNPLRRRGAFGLFNRPYQATTTPDGLRLTYKALDVPPSSVEVTKTFTLPPGKDYVIAEYEFAGNSTQGFISMNSVPWLRSESGPNWLAGRLGDNIVVLFWEGEGQGVAVPKSFSSLWNVEFASLRRIRMACWFGPGNVAAAVADMKRALERAHP